jgi:hypothetical protein
VDSLLDSLIPEESRQLPVASLLAYRSEPASEPFLQVLDKLELLLH